MTQPTQALFTVFSDSFKDIAWDKLDTEKYEKMTANNMAALSDVMEADLVRIKHQLAEKHLRLGKYINNGSLAYIFELETDKGLTLPSCVVRLEQMGTGPKGEAILPPGIENPFFRKPLMRTHNENYVASILPRAVSRDDYDTPLSDTDFRRSLLALKTSGVGPKTKEEILTDPDIKVGELISDMDRMIDVGPDQLMLMRKPDGGLVSYRDGTRAAIVTDLNSFWQRPGFHGIRQYCEAKRIDYPELKKADAFPPEEIAHIQEQMDKIYTHAEAELNAAIKSAAVPTKLKNAKAEEVGGKKSRSRVA